MTSEKCRYYITDGEVWNVTEAQKLRRITISQCAGGFGPLNGRKDLANGGSCRKQIPRFARDENERHPAELGSGPSRLRVNGAGLLPPERGERETSGAKVETREKGGLAGAAEGINPGSEDFVGGSFEVEEFDAEADARLDDANDD
jgi:hypothetical protein